jgi:hypothetical protein
LNREFDFILIGWWAAYLWTKAHKSKDIDIVVNYDVFDKLSVKYELVKNERLRNYEIRMKEYDIDVYLPYFSNLGLPVEEFEKHTTFVEGIKTLIPEILVILKQMVEVKRRGSIKGRKDLIDILTLLIHAPSDVEKYKALLDHYKVPQLLNELRTQITLFGERDLAYIDLNIQEFSRWKKKFLGAL